MCPQAAYRHFGCRIVDDLTYKGLRTLFLENDQLRIGVLLDKGADIFTFLHKPSDTDFLWRSPLGLRDPRRATPTRAHVGGHFLDTYHGGWQECLPGGGFYSSQGADIGLHGEVTHLGWDCDIVEDTPDAVEVALSVECIRTPLRLVRRMRLERGSPSLFMREELTNLSPAPLDFMWGHHPAFGAPFLSPNVRLFVPAHKALVQAPLFAGSGLLEPGIEFVWPMAPVGGGQLDLRQVQGPDAGFSELLYLHELDGGWCALVDAEQQLGLGMAWDLNVMPCVWLWIVYGRSPGYPWWDRTYCVALEPWTSYPNAFDNAAARGTLAQIAGHGRMEFALTTTAITGRADVTSVGLNGAVA